MTNCAVRGCKKQAGYWAVQYFFFQLPVCSEHYRTFYWCKSAEEIKERIDKHLI